METSIQITSAKGLITDLEWIEVYQSRYLLSDLCQFKVKKQYADGLEIGKTINVSASPNVIAPSWVFFRGKIEQTFPSGEYLIVEAYDELYEISKKKHSVTFERHTPIKIVSSLLGNKEILSGDEGSEIRRFSLHNEDLVVALRRLEHYVPGWHLFQYPDGMICYGSDKVWIKRKPNLHEENWVIEANPDLLTCYLIPIPHSSEITYRENNYIVHSIKHRAGFRESPKSELEIEQIA